MSGINPHLECSDGLSQSTLLIDGRVLSGNENVAVDISSYKYVMILLVAQNLGSASDVIPVDVIRLTQVVASTLYIRTNEAASYHASCTIGFPNTTQLTIRNVLKGSSSQSMNLYVFGFN